MVFAATVYEQPYTGYDVTGEGNFYAPEGSNLPMSSPDTHYVSLASSVDKVQIPEPTGGCTVGLTLQFFDVNSGSYNANLGLTSATDLGDVCQYSFNGVGNYPSGTKFFGWILANGENYKGSGSNDGYTITADQSSIQNLGGIAFKLCNTTCSGSFATGTPVINTQTRIISVIPLDDATVATGTPITISTDVYISSTDLTDDMIVKQRIQLINSPILGNIWGGTGDLVAQDSYNLEFIYDNLSSGFTTLSTTTTFAQIGERYLITEIIDPNFLPFFDWFDTIVKATTTTFLVGTTTSGDNITQSITDSFEQMSATASSTADVLSVRCNPFSGNFDIVMCLWRLVVPDNQTANALFEETYDMVFSRAPLGYFTDFISIMATTTVGSLTVIDATVPSGLIGTGSHIRLDLTNVLDPYLYSTTTSRFTSANASSTETLFTQTNYYWRIIIMILFVLYIIRRLFGAHIIPHNMFGEHGAVSDTNRGDDSYRLKEYLYKHRNERH